MQLNFLSVNRIALQTAIKEGDPVLIHDDFITTCIKILQHILNSQTVTNKKTSRLLLNLLLIHSAYFECLFNFVVTYSFLACPESSRSKAQIVVNQCTRVLLNWGSNFALFSWCLNIFGQAYRKLFFFLIKDLVKLMFFVFKKRTC